MIGSVIFTLVILVGLWVWLTKNNYFVKDKKHKETYVKEANSK